MSSVTMLSTLGCTWRITTVALGDFGGPGPKLDRRWSARSPARQNCHEQERTLVLLRTCPAQNYAH